MLLCFDLIMLSLIEKNGVILINDWNFNNCLNFKEDFKWFIHHVSEYNFFLRFISNSHLFHFTHVHSMSKHLQFPYSFSGFTPMRTISSIKITKSKSTREKSWSFPWFYISTYRLRNKQPTTYIHPNPLGPKKKNFLHQFHSNGNLLWWLCKQTMGNYLGVNNNVFSLNSRVTYNKGAVLF